MQRKRDTLVFVAMAKSRRHREKRYWSKRLREASYARWNYDSKPTSDSTGTFNFAKYQLEFDKLFHIGHTKDSTDNTISIVIDGTDTKINTTNALDTAISTMNTTNLQQI